MTSVSLAVTASFSVSHLYALHVCAYLFFCLCLSIKLKKSTLPPCLMSFLCTVCSLPSLCLSRTICLSGGVSVSPKYLSQQLVSCLKLPLSPPSLIGLGMSLHIYIITPWRNMSVCVCVCVRTCATMFHLIEAPCWHIGQIDQLVCQLSWQISPSVSLFL